MIITKTPLRITFTGGGSDMPSFFEKHDGHCINATIDKYVYVLVKKRSDNKIMDSSTVTGQFIDCGDSKYENKGNSLFSPVLFSSIRTPTC